ncbi:MAG: dihydroorotase, partial [Candidatus Limimorpha sp.]
MGYIIKNATLVNEGESLLASVILSGEFIERVIVGDFKYVENEWENYQVIDAKGKYLLPGAIDDH